MVSYVAWVMPKLPSVLISGLRLKRFLQICVSFLECIPVCSGQRISFCYAPPQEEWVLDVLNLRRRTFLDETGTNRNTVDVMALKTSSLNISF